ncbi:Hypothetical predicted protein [Cloeon dipterum]|uniref:Uncharacterized protein n=1 Tax=Cloeon dipterum TaxID=197152 RepID=A0A8S1D4S7_9INSE|nr:Hypothetical predicted protein [Cloeon dipterum]
MRQRGWFLKPAQTRSRHKYKGICRASGERVKKPPRIKKVVVLIADECQIFGCPCSNLRQVCYYAVSDGGNQHFPGPEDAGLQDYGLRFPSHLVIGSEKRVEAESSLRHLFLREMEELKLHNFSGRAPHQDELQGTARCHILLEFSPDAKKPDEPLSEKLRESKRLDELLIKPLPPSLGCALRAKEMLRLNNLMRHELQRRDVLRRIDNIRRGQDKIIIPFCLVYFCFCIGFPFPHQEKPRSAEPKLRIERI